MKELKDIIKGINENGSISLKCAYFSEDVYFAGKNADEDEEKERFTFLSLDHTKEDEDNFLNLFDNSRLGNLNTAYILLNGGAWLDIEEYDGVYYWAYHVCPVIPEGCKSKGISNKIIE